MLRKAMYASLNDSKKPLPTKLPIHQLTLSSQDSSDVVHSKGQVSTSELINDDIVDSNNCGIDSAKCITGKSNHSVLKTYPELKKRLKISKEPSKLLNYVIKKKKEKRNNSRALLGTLSPTKVSENGETSFSSSPAVNGKPKTKKKKKRQRGALAVFVAMNKSVGGKIPKNHFSEPEKGLLLKNKKRRRRKRKAFKNDIFNKTDSAGAEDEDSPIKKSKIEDKIPVRIVQAQRKFAKALPLSPSSMRIQEERHLLSTSVSRAKTEDFLTFLCLRNHPVLPEELEIFNHPCMPVSPLSDDQEENNTSSPPSPAQSQSSVSNVSNPSSTIPKSFSDSPAPSIDSPATGEGPCWESGVVRMYADGPKGLAGNRKDQKKYEELQPSDDADDPRELTKSVTPPLTFRVSSRPTHWAACRAKDKQLPRPIPKPVAVMPSLAGNAFNESALPARTCNSGNNAILPPPPLLHPVESTSCSPPPPPLLYIPSAALRVTHLHGPPTLKRYPSTSPTGERERGELVEQRRLSLDQNAGPPPLKRFPPIVIEHESAKNDESTEKGSYDQLMSPCDSGFRSVSSRSPSNFKINVEVSAMSKATVAGSCRASSSLSDLTKITSLETEDKGTTSRWPNKEMPLLRRHSSAGQDAVCFDELVYLRANSHSPPLLQRVSISADSKQVGPSFHLSKASAGPLETSGIRLQSAVPIETSDSQCEKAADRVETSSLELGTLSNRFGSVSDKSEPFACVVQTSGGHYRTSGNPIQRFGTRPETSGGGLDTSYSRLSPNFHPVPSGHVKQSAAQRGHSEASFIASTLHSNHSTSGEPSHLRASPLAMSRHSNSPQAFQEGSYPRPIPVGEALVSGRRLSPGLLREKNKCTYVFANRQTNLSTGNEPGPLQVSSLVMPSKHGMHISPNAVNLSSMRFHSSEDCGRSDGRRSFVGNTPYSGHHTSSSFIFRSQQSSSDPSAPFGNPLASKRIPSPRSDLFSRISYEPNNVVYMPRPGIDSPSPLSSDDHPTALRSSVRHKENSVQSSYPMWSHLRPGPYSVPSIVSGNSSPRPYTFSVKFPEGTLSAPQSESHSVGSRSNSSTPSLDGYSLASVQSTDNQLAPVNEKASHKSGGSPSTDPPGLHVVRQENFRSSQLPPAFQVGDLRHDSRTNTVFTDCAFSNTSSRDRFVRESEFCAPEDFNRKSSSPSHRHTHIPTKPPLSNSPSLNRETSSPLPRPNHHISNPPSSKSPGLKEKKSSGSAVIYSDTNVKRPLKSSAVTGRNTSASKNKQMVCPSAVFHPSEEEFKDPVAYIKMIRRDAERFGVCVIVPPESWKPEFQISDNVRFNSECQLIHRLQDRWGPAEDELACIKKHLDQQSISLVPVPQIGGCELDLPRFSKVMGQFGGLQKVIDSKKWAKVGEILKIPRAAQDRIGKLQDIYFKYLLSYDLLPQDEKADLLRQVQSEKGSKEQATDSWSIKGRSFSLVPFQRVARNVQAHFFKNSPSANDAEREFWRIVHNRESYVSVHRGTVDTNQEHSCFPTEKGDPYAKLGWNLNVLPHLPGSVLRHLGFVQDITIPWLHFDMLFTVRPWRSHPLALYTVEYLHSGAEKIWYCVPAGEKKNLASLLEQEDNEVFGTSRADTMISPSSLTDGGVDVTRVVQKQGQFVVVFPEAYVSSISCGYSISEAVSFAPSDWFTLGLKRYKELKDPAWLNEFSHERLLVGFAEQQLSDESQEVIQCLLEELKVIRDDEKSFMTELLELGLVETVDKEKNSTATTGKKGKKSVTSWTQTNSSCVLYCEECDKPCYLSAVTSDDEPQVLCLKHAIKHISTKGSPKGFRILSRYDTVRLDELVIKVGEKLKRLKGTTS